LDFNLAREPVTDVEGSAEAATLGGTIDYMAPEHLRALADLSFDNVDGRSDIYGLGVVMYEAVIGRRPFSPPRRGASGVDALLRAADERQCIGPGPRKRVLETPRALDAIIRRCLEPEPELRYQSATALAADLHAFADDRPLPNTRLPLPIRAGNWVRRSR